jgi:DNA-directed RNA polymerase subunit M/transcription elongation factor TFIIS
MKKQIEVKVLGTNNAICETCGQCGTLEKTLLKVGRHAGDHNMTIHFVCLLEKMNQARELSAQPK